MLLWSGGQILHNHLLSLRITGTISTFPTAGLKVWLNFPPCFYWILIFYISWKFYTNNPIAIGWFPGVTVKRNKLIFSFYCSVFIYTINGICQVFNIYYLYILYFYTYFSLKMANCRNESFNKIWKFAFDFVWSIFPGSNEYCFVSRKSQIFPWCPPNNKYINPLLFSEYW